LGFSCPCKILEARIKIGYMDNLLGEFNFEKQKGSISIFSLENFKISRSIMTIYFFIIKDFIIFALSFSSSKVHIGRKWDLTQKIHQYKRRNPLIIEN